MKNQQGSRGFNPILATKILRRDQYTCIYCGKVADVIDHVVPYCKGGVTTTANGVACCNSCNMIKKGNLSEEYLVKGLVHLAKYNENLDWVDSLYTEKIDSVRKAVRIMLQCEWSRSEISSALNIDKGTLKQIIGEDGIEL
jgi:hypothetical protein